MKRRFAFAAALSGLAASLLASSTATAGWVNRLWEPFDGTSINTSRWAFNPAWFNSNGSYGGTFQARYQTWYQSSNVSVSGGQMYIATRKQSAGGKNYTSGWISTAGRANGSWLYGKFQISAQWRQIPGGNVGFWLFKNGYGWPPEIDVVEAPGYHAGKYQMNVHWNNGSGNQNSWKYETVSNIGSAYNRYEAEWNSSVVIFRLNGVEKHRVYQPPTVSMYINVAGEVDGGPSDTFYGNPANMPAATNVARVDWVSVDQWQ